MNELVSVIVPCYNQAQYLPDALGSVQAQTHPHWECIIVDDGSPDDTEAVAMAWALQDARFKYVRKENGGLSSARNAGLAVADGTYIQFLDADDLIHPDKFALQIKALDNTGENALSISSYFASTESDLNQPYPSRFLSPRFRTHDYLHELITDWEVLLSIPVHCFLIKSAIFRNNNIRFNEDLPNHEDWDCWMNILKLNPEVRYIDAKLATYRIREDAMCNDIGKMRQGHLMAIDFQRETFSSNSAEYKLLNKKYNLVRYGVSADNSYLVIWGLMKKAIRRLMAPLIKRVNIH